MQVRVSWRPSTLGALLALLFYSASLQPSLLPRTWVMQSVVSGLLVAIGYGLGVAIAAIVRRLEIPPPPARFQTWILRVSFGVAAAIALVTMWQHFEWQNDQRALFGIDEVAVWWWLLTVPTTLFIAGLMILAGRGLGALFRWLSGLLENAVGGPLARALGAAAIVAVAVLGITGLLSILAFDTLSSALAVRDGVTPAGVEQPTSTLRSGGPGSQIAWESMGRQGKSFVSGGPTKADISNHNGVEAEEPIRVYVGMRSAGDARQRAELALAELVRTGAFERQVLVLATTTGTGYVDPMAADTLELMFDGDTAIAGMQYSYLPSWMSILADEEASQDAARALFDVVHPYWKALPEGNRPELYLFGMSLGSYGVESVLGSINMINTPVDGVILVGPPFINELRNSLTENRDEGSPEWLPVYGGGETVRFISTDPDPMGSWSGMRVLYMQHASDPMSFYSADLAFSEPNWLQDSERGPDVSAEMWWIPVATMVQVALDLPSTGAIPRGHGHLFTAHEYVDAWLMLVQPDPWPADRTDHIKGYFEN